MINKQKMIIDIGPLNSVFHQIQPKQTMTLSNNTEKPKALPSKEIYDFFEYLAKQNNLFAQYTVGICFSYGIGVDKNDLKALHWYKLAAEGNFADAQYAIGLFYENSKETEVSKMLSIKWYTKAANQQHVDAILALGDYYINQLYERKHAYYWYKKAAYLGITDAQAKLGYLYENGIGTFQNLKSAIYWYTIASRKQNDNANLGLARCLSEIEKQSNITSDILKECTRIGQNLSGFYYYGPLGFQNYLHIIFLNFKRKAITGSAAALYGIGYFYEYGFYVKRDVGKALRFYKYAAQKGDAAAQSKLALWYYKGIHIRKDYQKAYKWHTSAAIHGDSNSQIKIHFWYQSLSSHHTKSDANTTIKKPLKKKNPSRKLDKFYNHYASMHTISEYNWFILNENNDNKEYTDSINLYNTLNEYSTEDSDYENIDYFIRNVCHNSTSKLIEECLKYYYCTIPTNSNMNTYPMYRYWKYKSPR